MKVELTLKVLINLIKYQMFVCKRYSSSRFDRRRPVTKNSWALPMVTIGSPTLVNDRDAPYSQLLIVNSGFPNVTLGSFYRLNAYLMPFINF